jgi:hypothetical protein
VRSTTNRRRRASRGFARAGAVLAAFALFGGATAAGAAPTPLAPIVFVPLDDRPVTYQLPTMLGAIAGQRVIVPPRAMLGHYLTPGAPRALLAWLDATTPGASALVASADMVAYGGLVASRVPGLAGDEAEARLRALAALKAKHAIPFVGAFGTVMRLAPTGVPRLGPGADAWATGETVDLIEQYANLPDPLQTDEQRGFAARLRERIGPATLDAYLRARARNRDVDETELRLAAEGGFDRLVIGQDDAGPTGLHLRDLAALERLGRALDLGDRASIEPGADELGMVMLARAFARNAHWTPTVSVAYSRADGGSVVDHLEYVPIDTTIGRIVGACGARRVADDADIRLYVRVADTSDADERAFEDRLAADVAAGKSVAVADLTFLKGGPGPEQRALTEALIDRGIAGKIDAFASWNTDANTVGTALPEAIAAGAGRRTGTYDARAHAEFLLDRYADDYAFHQFVRPVLNETLRGRGIDTTLLLPDVANEASSLNRSLLWPRSLRLLTQSEPAFADAGLVITLPWERTFETQLDVRLAPRRR